MDVLVRNVNPVVVDKLNELAKLEGISRESYLRKYLTDLVVLKELKNEFDRYQQTLDKVSDVFVVYFKRLEIMEQNYEKLFLILSMVTGIDLDEVNEFIKEEQNV